MKNICFYILIIICLVFLFPVILTSRFTSVDVAGSFENNTENIERTPYNYKEYGTINLINATTNEVSEVKLDEYLLRSSKRRNACKL